jgi:hypothetical protein
MRKAVLGAMVAVYGLCLATGCGETKKEEAKPTMKPEELKDAYKGAKLKNFSTGG